MKRKILITTLLLMPLLSLNLSAGTIKCNGSYCMVDFSKKSPIVQTKDIEKIEIKQDIEKIEKYETLMVDNIETIVFSHERYVMTEDEIAEYDLNEMQKNLLIPVLNSNNLPNSDYLCEDNLKPIQVVGVENTYECT